MIPVGRPYRAYFVDGTESKPQHHSREVVAWDDQGFALVVDVRRGRLRRADEFPNFRGLEPDEPRVVAAVPGGGWYGEYQEEDGRVSSWPVVAWGVREDGSLVPIDSDRDGMSNNPVHVGNFLRLAHPDLPPETEPSE